MIMSVPVSQLLFLRLINITSCNYDDIDHGILIRTTKEKSKKEMNR